MYIYSYTNIYKAEMVKVHSILLRVAHRHQRRYILPSTHGGGQLRAGPFKIDPREVQTAGFLPMYVCIYIYIYIYIYRFMYVYILL